jgi:transcriptional regulator with XRE-family HTH domain
MDAISCFYEVGTMLSDKLIQLRKKRGLGQDDLAAYLNITRQAYSLYETAKREMNYQSLCMLADFYSVTTDYLLGRCDTANIFVEPGELDLLYGYRQLDNRGRNAVKALLDFEESQVSGKIK